MCRGRFNWPQRHTTTASGLGFCDLNQPLQASMNSSFRGGRLAFERKLAQRQRRMSETQLRRFSQARRKLRQALLALEPAKCLQLSVSGAARADEIRLVRVREPVRPPLRLPYHRPLVDPERRVTRARERECLGDPIEPFRVSDRV